MPWRGERKWAVGQGFGIGDGDVTILKFITTAANTGKVLGWNVSDSAGTMTMDIRGTSTSFNLAVDSNGQVLGAAASAVKALKVGGISLSLLDADGKVIGAAKVGFPTAEQDFCHYHCNYWYQGCGGAARSGTSLY